MFRVTPGKCVVLNNLLKPGFVREEASEIGRKDAVFYIAQDLLVLIVGQLAENVVSVLLKNCDCLVEVMVLHRGSAVDCS